MPTTLPTDDNALRPDIATAAKSFTERLRKLTEGRNKSALSLKAGMPANAISNYLSKGQIPRLDYAAALAHVLGVSVDWLANAGPDDDALRRDTATAAVRLDAANELAFSAVTIEGARLFRLERTAEGIIGTFAVFGTVIVDGKRLSGYESVRVQMTERQKI